jgi:hypothetical protein
MALSISLISSSIVILAQGSLPRISFSGLSDSLYACLPDSLILFGYHSGMEMAIASGKPGGNHGAIANSLRYAGLAT